MKANILVVEDDPSNRKFMCDLLEVKGYGVIVAVNGQEAIRMARERTPDLILMDMRMPVMDGWEASRALKDDPDTREIPVWALTASALPGDEEAMRKAGCDEYVTKPIDIKEFMRRIDGFFAGGEK